MASFVTLLARPRVRDALFCVSLLAAVWVVFWPSLDHVPRADQWAYLTDTQHCRNFGELWSTSYSYNRVRAVGPGDTELFRPVLFTLLAVEKHLFGNNFLPSQAISLGLHSLIVLLVFALFRLMASSAQSVPQGPKTGWPPASFSGIELLPYALTAFFALNFASMELVVWAHLQGYLLFLVFLLAALLLAWRHLHPPVTAPRPAGWRLAGCWSCATFSAFTFELGQFLGVLLGLALAKIAWNAPRRRVGLCSAACFLAILPIYQGVNHWDRIVHQGRFPAENLPASIQEKALTLDTLKHTGRFLAFTIVQPFFPSATGWWYEGERIHIQEPALGWSKYVKPSAKLVVSYGVAFVFFALCWAGCRRWLHSGHNRLWPMAWVSAGLLVLYTGITVLGRMNLRPSRVMLCSNSYYTYVALLLFLIAAMTVWQALSRTRLLHGSAAALSAGLVFLACCSGGRIWRVSDHLRERYAPFAGTVRQLESFLAEHRHDRDFRVAFDIRRDDPFPVTHGVPCPLVLFPEWVDNYDPRYVISFPQGKLVVTRADVWRQSHPTGWSTGPQLFPDLIRVGTDANVWRWQGALYRTLSWDWDGRPAASGGR